MKNSKFIKAIAILLTIGCQYLFETDGGAFFFYGAPQVSRTRST